MVCDVAGWRSLSAEAMACARAPIPSTHSTLNWAGMHCRGVPTERAKAGSEIAGTSHPLLPALPSLAPNATCEPVNVAKEQKTELTASLEAHMPVTLRLPPSTATQRFKWTQRRPSRAAMTPSRRRAGSCAHHHALPLGTRVVCCGRAALPDRYACTSAGLI